MATTTKIPYDACNSMVCLPRIGQDYYKDMDAVNKMYCEIKAYRIELGEYGLVCNEIFDLF